MSMHESDTKTISLRMAGDLHAVAKEVAGQRGISLTEFINHSVQVAVANEPLPAAPGGSATPYEVHVSFALGGADADGRAYRVVDGLRSVTELAGGSDVTARLIRLAPMPPRT